jgi:hypothetical protein
MLNATRNNGVYLDGGGGLEKPNVNSTLILLQTLAPVLYEKKATCLNMNRWGDISCIGATL